MNESLDASLVKVKTGAQDLLDHYEAEDGGFLDRVIPGDEMWCHHYEPESKRQSMGWLHLNSTAKK